MLDHEDSDNMNNFPTGLNNRGGGHGPPATTPMELNKRGGVNRGGGRVVLEITWFEKY